MGKSPIPHLGRLVLLLWLLVAVVYFTLTYDYIRISLNDRAFAEYLRFAVQVAGQQNRPARELRNSLLVKADELELPIQGDEIIISGSGQNLSVVVGYTVNLEVPIVERGLYSKVFQHQVSYKSLN